MLSDLAGDPDLPDINDHVVEPGSRWEMLDGELIYVPPTDAPHAERQFQLCALLEAHTGPEFQAACELLTRTSKIDDFAPDASVYPSAPDPRTGKRQLEQLAFEVLSTQSIGNAARKAAKLVGRGVRRVFAIDIERSRMLEWSTELENWSLLDPAGAIVDPALATPLPIDALIHEAKTDDAVARALVARHNPVIEAAIEAMRAESTAEAVAAVLSARGVAVTPAEREQILGERDPARLARWIARAAVCTSAAELLAER